MSKQSRTVRVYSVTEHTPGYMPDDDDVPFLARSRREAVRYAVSLVHKLRQAGYTVTGNGRDGYWRAWRARVHNDLGRVVTVNELVITREDWLDYCGIDY